jgi:rhamnose transport system permease protein
MTSATATSPTMPRVRAAFPYWHEAVLAALLAGAVFLAGVLEPRFVEPSVQVRLAGDAWPMALVALPMAMIVITAGIDLSVGSIMGLCAVVFGLTVEAGGGLTAGVLAALVTGAVAGFLNGALIAWVRVHPLIVTLATMAGYRGIALALTEGRTIHGFPPGLGEWVQSEVLGMPLPMWGFLIAAAVTGIFLSQTAYGRYLYAIGHNETASRFSGVPVASIKLALYTLSGVTAGIGAVLLVSRYEQAKADFATALELEVITAVVLGGVSIFGGRGNIVGVVLGLVLLHECNKFVPWHWHVSELNPLITGGLLISSVLLNSLIQRRSR